MRAATEGRGAARRQAAVALGALLAVAALHAWLVRGYVSAFWGDSGVLLHQVDRFAHGEMPYRDFMLTAPPFGLWLVGTGARLLGSDLAAVWTLTTAVFFGIGVAYWWYAAALVPGRHLGAVSVAGLLLAVSFAQLGGQALPLGSYLLAAPVGGLVLLLAAAIALRWGEEGNLVALAAIGVLTGLCVIAKQDFWPPAFVLMVMVGGVQVVRGNRLGAFLMVLGTAVVVAGGAGIVAAQAGPDHLRRILTGYGLADRGLSRALPSWELLTLDGIMLALTVAAVALVLALTGVGAARARRVLASALGTAAGLTGLWVLMAVRVAERVREAGLPTWHTAIESLARRTSGDRFWAGLFSHLHTELGHHFFPVLLPIAALVVVWWQRRRLRGRQAVLLAALLAFCLAARVRRGFEYTEWFQILLELPVYVYLGLAVLEERAGRVIGLLLAATLLSGAYFYWDLGRGPLTRRGPFPAIETARGVIHQPASGVADYRFFRDLLDRLDPSGTRPVFSFGHNGALAYYLRRPNPTPLTSGFTVSPIAPDSALRLLRASDPPPFLIYNPVYVRVSAPAGVDPRRWQQLRGPDHRVQDVKYFERAAEGCARVGFTGPPARPFFEVYDCARGAGG